MLVSVIDEGCYRLKDPVNATMSLTGSVSVTGTVNVNGTVNGSHAYYDCDYGYQLCPPVKSQLKCGDKFYLICDHDESDGNNLKWHYNGTKILLESDDPPICGKYTCAWFAAQYIYTYIHTYFASFLAIYILTSLVSSICHFSWF